jgi:hypothetical protein
MVGYLLELFPKGALARATKLIRQPLIAGF